MLYCLRQNDTENDVGKWEAWLQFELMYAFTLMTKAANDVALCTGLHDNTLSDVVREESYQSSGRPDLTIQVWTNDLITEAHYMKIKCRSSKEEDSAFVWRIKEDIDTVLNTEWRERRTSEDAISVWAIAISVSRGDGHLEKLMHEAVEEKGIGWQVIDLKNEGEIKVWTYEKRERGLNAQLLFGYANQRSLALYVERGDGELPEPWG